MAQWEPSTLKRHEEGDSMAFQAKLTGAGVNDMCNMDDLTKDTILNLLKDRFKKEIVYTYVGDIIVSVNPFKNVGAVGKSIRNRYKKGGAQNAQLLMPHCYMLVDQTYAQMMTEQKSQSILISGESGAGKTEAMKICLTYIGEISVKKDGKGGKDEADPTAARLMQTNPVMEAIGNAKTVRNDNSSRFGKHFDIQFNEKGQILGAFTTSYLLEKPRITEHMRGERNYHIFYMCCKSDPSIRDPVGIQTWQNYGICSQTGTVAEVNSWNDNAEFKDMHAAFILLGFSEQQRMELYTLVSLCLMLGNVQFEDPEQGEGCLIKTPESLEKAAEMMQVAPEDLGQAVTSKTMGGGVIEVFIKPLEARQAAGARNSMIQYIYCLLFDWCVDVVNDYIAVDSCDFAIGILDIFGFENFILNSFPQLCINFTNESLHNLFIEHVFKLEQEMYIREEVEWNFVEYEDNQHTIDLISKRPVCLYGLLDEGCASGAGTDSSVLQNFNGVFKDPKKHKSYIKPKKSADKCFIVSHYAGEVAYDITGFVEKNKDELSMDIEELTTVKTSFQQLMDLAKRDVEKKADADAAKAASSKKNKGGGKKKKTVSRTFGDSLFALMAKLRATEHHYIRCLKPNQTLKAGDWDNEFMFRQLSYSGTLEVTEIRKAGLNVRRPLAHFYRYYKICADDQTMLRAGTVTKRCIMLLEQLGIDENTWRVGKTLVFLKNYEIMETLDKMRELKIVEYVIILQSYFRMCRDMQFFRRFRRQVCRIQGYIKTQVIREAFEELCQATRVIQKYARRRMYYNLYRTVLTEHTKPEEDMDYVKVREAMHKALTKLNPSLNFFAPAQAGASKSTKRAKSRRRSAAGAAVGRGGGANTGEDPTMPRFRTRHKGWVTARFNSGKHVSQAAFCQVRLGMVTVYDDEECRVPLASLALSDLMPLDEAGGGPLALRAMVPPSLAAIAAAKKKASAATKKGAVESDGKLPTEYDTLTLSEPPADKLPEGTSAVDAMEQMRKKIEEGVAEAKVLDSDLNLSFNLGVDTEAAPDEALEVVTEGYLHSKFLQLPEGQPITHKMVRRAWDTSTLGWARAYFVLLNNGKLKYYESAAEAAKAAGKRVELGEINLRLFAVSEVDEAFDPAAEAEKRAALMSSKGGKGAKGAKGAAAPVVAGKKAKPVEMKIEGDFYSLVKGKQLDLRCGRTVFRVASGVPAIAEEWLNTLTAATTTMYQKSPIFPQNSVRVHLVNGEVTRQLVSENSVCHNLIRRMCKDLNINNPGEWGLYELWDHADLPDMPGMKERKIPNNEEIVDQTILKWEVATRLRWGMVAAMPEDSFKLILKKATSLTPTVRAKEELHLEYRQAWNNYTDGTFTLEAREHNGDEAEGTGGSAADHRGPTEEDDEVWDMAACAAFKEAFDKKMSDAQAEEEEGGLTAERQREIQRNLEHNITELEPSEIANVEDHYLPASWFAEGPDASKKGEWRKRICARFKELLVEEILEGDEEMTVMRRLLFEYRMEADPNSYAIMNLFVDRVRRSPKCFGMTFMAAIWTQDRTHNVLIHVNYIGLQLFNLGESQSLLASFHYLDSLVSWLALNDMLTLHVVHTPTKRSAKLHFLTREACQIKVMLTRYADAVLSELQRVDKERALRKKVEGMSKRGLMA